MVQSLLDLPPELLVHLLAFLPIQTLLRFGQTCRYSQSLASSSLHTLSLGIHPSRVSGIISKLAATQYPLPKRVASAFSPIDHPFVSSTDSSESWQSRRSSIESEYLAEEPLDDDDPYRVSMLIPDAHSFDYMTLLTFHTALTKSILTRHGGTLRNLDLSLWTLTPTIAKAISTLSALRALSIRVEDFPHVRAAPRSRIALQRVEEREGWDILTKSAVWAPRLHALRIEGGELSTAQLAQLLSRSRWIRELWLCKCGLIGKELWSWLRAEWEGRAALRILGVMRCGGQLDEETMDVIGQLKGLQFLSLQGCHGADSDAVERINKDSWQIPEVVPPLPRIREQDASSFIEVDPAYIADE